MLFARTKGSNKGSEMCIFQSGKIMTYTVSYTYQNAEKNHLYCRICISGNFHIYHLPADNGAVGCTLERKAMCCSPHV